jgi:hypothetical protein
MVEEPTGGTAMAEKGDASQDEVKELTDQFYVTLRAYVARLDKEDETRSPKSFKQIEDLLKEGRATWSDAYQIEQLLVDLFDERSLEVELQSRLLEAESSLRPALAAYYVKLAGALKTPADLRALLARLVNDLQWRYTVNEVKRTYSKEITKVTGLIFIVAIGSFAAAVLGTAVLGRVLSGAGDAALLLLAGLAGGWGAGFSMLASLKGRLDAADLNDLKLMKSRWILWSRPLIGVGAACILYFFLVSGLLGGTAFPDLKREQEPSVSRQSAAALVGSPSTTESRTAPAGGNAPTPIQSSRTDLALLVVWCFVAGFSERLVPALLTKTEARAIGQSSLGPDRFKPGPADGEGADQVRASGRGQAKTESRSSDPAAPPSGRTATEPPKTS